MKVKEPKMQKAGNVDLEPYLWVSRYADYLYTFALVRIYNEEQARDLVQETFLAGLENASSFENRSAEKTWLTAILKNKIYDLYRRQARYVLQEETIADHFFRQGDGHWNKGQRPLVFGSGQYHLLELKEHQHILRACIRKLPAAWQAVFTMKHIEECSSAAICRQLRLTQANFWIIIHRSKLHLRACLQKHL